MVDENHETVKDYFSVMMVCRHFPPARHSGTIRSEAFAHYFPDFGIRPVILCGPPPDQSLGMTVAVDDSFLDSDAWAEVVRLTWPTPKLNSWLCRMPGASFLHQYTRLVRSVHTLDDCVDTLIARHQVKAIYATYSPADNLIIGANAAQRHNIPLVIDLRDPWTHIAVPRYRHVIDAMFAHRIERRLLLSAESIVVTTATHAKLLVEELAIPTAKILVLPNGYDDRDFSRVKMSSSNHVFKIVYTGELSLRAARKSTVRTKLKRLFGLDYDPMRSDFSGRSPENFLRAFNCFAQRRSDARQRISIRFVGVSEADALKIKQLVVWPEVVVCKGRVSSQEAIDEAMNADLLLLTQIRTRLRKKEISPCIPAKLYTYLRTGRRILACVQRDSEMWRLIEEYQVGQVASPDDISKQAAVLDDEFRKWENGSVAVFQPTSGFLKEYNRRSLTGQLARHINRLARAT